MRTYRYKLSLLDMVMDVARYLFTTKPKCFSVHPTAVTVVDGDTIRVAGITYRLSGFDTPETFTACCPHEHELGRQATEMLRHLVFAAPSLEIVVHDPDKYNRPVAVLSVAGVNVADHMIGSGFARAYNGHTERRAWCHCP